jgi:hypothetical protein
MPIHSAWRTMIRKTSLLRTVPTACGQAADKFTPVAIPVFAIPALRPASRDFRHNRSSELAHGSDFHQAPCSERSYLFTMSDIIQISAAAHMRRTDFAHPRQAWRPDGERAIVISRTSNDSIKAKARSNPKIPAGGARRDRTDDLLLAKQALSQLSYGPSAKVHSYSWPTVI